MIPSRDMSSSKKTSPDGNIERSSRRESPTRSGAESVMPYDESESKGKQVETMFDSIAPAYDLMNTIMSLGMCVRWRNRALDMAARIMDASPRSILDVATGTGDVAFALHARYPEARISGIDLSEGMLRIAREKSKEIQGSENIEFRQGDSLAIGYADASFDLVTVAYGVRNFENLEKGYSEMLRVLRPGGVICVVELSMPASALPLLFYKAYTRGVIPLAGRIVSGDPRAYSYLHESIEAAPQRDAMTSIMSRAGFVGAEWKSLIPGVVTIYTARRP